MDPWMMNTYPVEWSYYVAAHCSACIICKDINFGNVFYHTNDVRAMWVNYMVEQGYGRAFKRLKVKHVD